MMQEHRLLSGSRCSCRKESINMTKKQKHLLARIIVAAVLFAAGGLLHLEGWAELGVYLVCYGVIGWDIV